jgi:hypothetical protein
MSMLYRYPGSVYCDGHMVDHITVPDTEDDSTVALGWFRTIAEAIAVHESKTAVPVVSEPVTAEEKAEVVAPIEAPKRRGRPPKAANVD